MIPVYNIFKVQFKGTVKYIVVYYYFKTSIILNLSIPITSFFVDLYPIHLEKNDEKYIRMVSNLRAKFCQDGIVTLPGFLRLGAIPDITRASITINNDYGIQI